MNTIVRYFKLLMVVGLTASASIGAIQTANANTNQLSKNSDNNRSETAASQLGKPQQIQRINSGINTPTRELPTFQVDAKPQRSKGILGVLGGRYVKEDRHPSFRNSTLKK